jgi:hypothetical protein
MSQRFRLLAAAGYNFWTAFDITGMNDDSPVVPLNPGAEDVPYAPVLHYTPSPSGITRKPSSGPTGLLDKLRLPLQNLLKFGRLSPAVCHYQPA